MLQRALRRFNHYEVLGVSYDANSLAIKQAFYKLAKKYHPDASSEKNSEKFKEITEAYKVLSDSELRQVYDRKLESGQIPQSKAAADSAQRPAEQQVNPDESPYQQAYMNVFNLERRSKLRERRMETGQHLNDPMYKKSRLDYARDLAFGYGLFLAAAAAMISTISWFVAPKKDRELFKMLSEELQLVKAERRVQENLEKLHR